MKQSEVRELSVAELQEELGKTRKAYADLKNGSRSIAIREPNTVTYCKKIYSEISYGVN